MKVEVDWGPGAYRGDIRSAIKIANYAKGKSSSREEDNVLIEKVLEEFETKLKLAVLEVVGGKYLVFVTVCSKDLPNCMCEFNILREESSGIYDSPWTQWSTEPKTFKYRSRIALEPCTTEAMVKLIVERLQK